MVEKLFQEVSDQEPIVKCDGSYSYPFHFLSGVPHGSHLCPMLFNIFFNDIIKVQFWYHRIVFFLLMISRYFGEVTCSAYQNRLLSSLDEISKWCDENAMELNVVNCLVTFFSRSDMVRPYNYRINGARLKVVLIWSGLWVL